MSSPNNPAELQQTEIETLKAIYGEDADFLAHPLPNQPKAWGKPAATAPEYGIRVRGLHQGVQEDSSRAVGVVLVVKVSSPSSV